ncbi:putative transcription factor interactor and regulator C3H-WRC/GRF family [Helianthus anomalus]
MRIRKNAKISALLYTNSNLSSVADQCMLQKNLCQLNQSPWDIITFPSSDSSSSFYRFDDNEVYYNVNVAGNGSSIDSIGGFESMASKTLGLGENDNVNGRDNGYEENLGFKEEGGTSEIQEEIKLCGMSDEKGWQCGSVVKNGNTMCDHHITKLQDQAVWTTKKKSGPGSGVATGARPRRPKKRPTTDPHEFYYYSGFGPSWGKKRGSTCTTLNVDNKAASVASNSNTSSISGDMDVQEEMGKRFEPDTSKVEPVALDNYLDDEDEEIEKVFIGKKRGRKPIKERSLKSLM